MTIAQIIAEYTGLPEKEAGEMFAISHLQTLPKGAFFIRAGEQPQKLGLVLKGLFRYLYIDREGNEYTKSFLPEGNFLTAYSSMIKGEGSYFFIEALEDSEILVFSYADWHNLRAAGTVWKDFLLVQLERAFMMKEQRERDLLLFDAETRYLNFTRDFPGLITRIKQHQVASYLGIKPESLSRIKKNIEALT